MYFMAMMSKHYKDYMETREKISYDLGYMIPFAEFLTMKYMNISATMIKDMVAEFFEPMGGMSK